MKTSRFLDKNSIFSTYHVVQEILFNYSCYRDIPNVCWSHWGIYDCYRKIGSGVVTTSSKYCAFGLWCYGNEHITNCMRGEHLIYLFWHIETVQQCLTYLFFYLDSEFHLQNKPINGKKNQKQWTGKQCI